MDLIQEAFVRLWKKRKNVRPDQAKAYLFKTCLNLAANRRRYLRLRGILFPSGSEENEASGTEKDGEQDLLSREREILATQLLAKLPEKYRAVLILCRFSNLSQQEIGASLGIPAGTVASRHNTALKRLQTYAEKHQGVSR